MTGRIRRYAKRKAVNFKKEMNERVLNIPNTLTIIRILMSIGLIFMIFGGYSGSSIAWVFIIAALTDFFDGQIARRFNMETRFGKIMDPIADRILVGTVVLALIMKMGFYNSAQSLMLIMSREIIALPAFIFIKKGDVEFNVRFSGKLTTFLQCCAVPALLFELPFANYLIVATFFAGIYSGVIYTKQMLDERKK